MCSFLILQNQPKLHLIYEELVRQKLEPKFSEGDNRETITYTYGNYDYLILLDKNTGQLSILVMDAISQTQLDFYKSYFRPRYTPAHLYQFWMTSLEGLQFLVVRFNQVQSQRQRLEKLLEES
jgi:hypothetical protein